jgi:hypothetical protein
MLPSWRTTEDERKPFTERYGRGPTEEEKKIGKQHIFVSSFFLYVCTLRPVEGREESDRALEKSVREYNRWFGGRCGKAFPRFNTFDEFKEHSAWLVECFVGCDPVLEEVERLVRNLGSKRIIALMEERSGEWEEEVVD